MDDKPAVWKLQDAKARFSELVRRAREGAPQHVTLHGKEAVVVVDPSRYEIRERPAPVAREETLAGFVERSAKYRGVADSIDFERPFPMHVDPRPISFDEDEK